MSFRISCSMALRRRQRGAKRPCTASSPGLLGQRRVVILRIGASQIKHLHVATPVSVLIEPKSVFGAVANPFASFPPAHAERSTQRQFCHTWESNSAGWNRIALWAFCDSDFVRCVAGTWKMAPGDEYEARAKECIEAADRLKHPANRLALLELARRWMHLAFKVKTVEDRKARLGMPCWIHRAATIAPTEPPPSISEGTSLPRSPFMPGAGLEWSPCSGSGAPSSSGSFRRRAFGYVTSAPPPITVTPNSNRYLCGECGTLLVVAD